MSAQGILDRYRQPQYTGENRCIPCTGVNIAIAAVLAVIIGLATLTYGADITGAALAGIGVFLIAIGVIYLRGYLLPGTPWFTKK